MYYDSIEEAIKAAPDCTHVLTTGSKWSGKPSLDGKFAPVVLTKYRGADQFLCATDTSAHDGAEIDEKCWVVVLDRTTPHISEHPDVQQRLAAARFDTASGHIPAHQFLESGVKHMKDRASQRDAEDGERSMRRCVEAFNALEGTDLTETQGWRFMIMLKMARSVSGDFTADDYEDMAAYSGLAGECASTQETN